jgi:hypothetical protein
VEPEDGPGLEHLARHIARPPVNLERMRWAGGAEEVAYTPKPKWGEEKGEEHLDPLDLLARFTRGDSPPLAGGRRPTFPHSGRSAPSPRPRGGGRAGRGRGRATV